MPANATGPPSTARNAAESRPDAIVSASGRDRLQPSQAYQFHRSSQPLPQLRWRRSQRATHRRQFLPPARASAQRKFPRILAARRAIGLGAMCCFSPQRQRSSRNSARACAARRYDAFASGKPVSGSDGGAVSGLFATPIAIRPKRLRSCRHHIEAAILRNLKMAFAPQNRGGSGRAGPSGPPFPCSVWVPFGEAPHD
jgi:hypothetical protein